MADPAQGTNTGPSTGVPPTGVIGLGAIGHGVAASLRRAGVDLTVYDVRSEAAAAFADGARVAVSPAELADHVEVAVVAVVDDDQVRSVVSGPDGLLTTARPGSTIVVVSTIATDTVAEVAAAAAAKGVALLDCGVSGGPGAAADGALVCMLGGDPATVERIRPVLEVFGGEVLLMGPLGAGLSAKLARNVVQYGSWLAAYEGQVLAEAAGIDLAMLARAIKASDRRIGGASTLMFRSTVRPLRDDAPADAGLIGPMTSAAGLAHKDLRSALSLADALGVGLPMARLAEEFCDAIFGVGPPSTAQAPDDVRGSKP